MMTQLVTITLPEQDEMLRRLRAVSDLEAYEACFYYFIVPYAGKPANAIGIVSILQRAFLKFRKRQPRQVAAWLYGRIEDYVRALVDDEKAQQQALEQMAAVKRSLFS